MKFIDFDEAYSSSWHNYTKDFISYDDTNLKEILQLWTEILGDCRKVLIRPEGVYLEQGKNTRYFVGTLDFLQSGGDLLKLKNCDGFEKLVKQYQNPQQFSANTFEVRCLIFVQKLPNISNIVISPRVIAKGRIKYPDFKFNHLILDDIFCECKSPISYNRIESSRIRQFMEKVAPGLANIKVPQNIRVEIFYEKLPRNFNKNLAEHLVACINTVIQRKEFNTSVCMNYKDIQSQIQFICTESTKPIYFKNAHVALGIDSNKDIIYPRVQEAQSILVLEKNQKLYRDYDRLFKEACSQLPDNRYSMIFIEPIGYPDANLVNSIQRKFTKEYVPNKLLCCILMYNMQKNIKVICSNEKKQSLIKQLLTSY